MQFMQPPDHPKKIDAGHMCVRLSLVWTFSIFLGLIIIQILLCFPAIRSNLDGVNIVQDALIYTDCKVIPAEFDKDDVRYYSAMSNIHLGCSDEALADLGRIASTGDGRARIYTWHLGFSLLALGRLDDAVRVWKQTPDIASELEAALLLRGNESEAAVQPQNAELSYKAYLLLNPTFDRYEFLGDFYIRVGQDSKAIEAFKQGSRIATKTDSAFLAGRIAELQEDWNVAAGYYRQAIEEGSSSIAPGVRLAKILIYRLGDQESGITICEQVIQIDAGDYACYEILGQVYIARGNSHKAIEWLTLGAVNVTGRYRNIYKSGFYNQIGWILLDLERPDEAEANFNKALSLSLYNADARRGLAFVSIAKGDFLSAAQALEQAIEVQGEQRGAVSYSWYDELGGIYEQVGDISSAKQFYEKALSLNPDDGFALDRIAALRNRSE